MKWILHFAVERKKESWERDTKAHRSTPATVAYLMRNCTKEAYHVASKVTSVNLSFSTNQPTQVLCGIQFPDAARSQAFYIWCSIIDRNPSTPASKSELEDELSGSVCFLLTMQNS
jgi:hypothetical protein